MTKTNMISTLQARETEAWQALHDYEYALCPRTEERHGWELNDVGYNSRLSKWAELNDLLNLFGITPVHNEEVTLQSIKFYQEVEAAKHD